MNENINLVEILKDCPKGTKFYSSMYGELIYSSMYTDSLDPKIYFIDENNRSTINGYPLVIGYYRDGRLYATKGECTIFPSKDQRDWSKFTAPWLKKEKFDPRTLKPFDKVLVKNDNSGSIWRVALFSCIMSNGIFCECIWDQGVPYNDETKHLIGTSDDPDEKYIWWKE